MKIAILANGYPNRVKNLMVGTFVEDRALLYKESGHQVAVFSRPSGLPSEENEQGIAVLRFTEKEAVNRIQAFSPDVLAVHAPHRYSLNVARRLSVPKVIWFHGWEVEANHPVFADLPFLLRKGMRFYDRWKLFRLKRFLSKESWVVFNSSWLRERAATNLAFDFSGERTFVIPNPVDFRKFPQPLPKVKKDQPIGVIMVALRHHKGVDLLIKATSGMKNTRIMLYGNGLLAPALNNLIKECDSPISIRNEIVPHEKISAFLSQFDYAVLVSRYEPQGLFLLEAMACGLPGVATKVGGIPEYFQDDCTGYLAEPENPKSIRQALLKLLAPEKIEEMGKTARAMAEAFCSYEKIIPMEIEVLKKAATTALFKK